MKQLSIGGGAMTASNLALGCMRIVRVSRQDADRLLKTALELGVDHFDHADVYGGGNSEILFGELLNLRSDLRSRIKIQSKCTLVRNEVETLYNDQSKQYILDSVDGILKRLKTDYLDCFLLHTPDTLVEPEEVAEAFDILISRGKVRHFGVSNHKPLQIKDGESLNGTALYTSGMAATKELLLQTRMTALYTCNNLMTVGALACLIKEGVKVPEQVALLGMGSYIWADLTNPPLSLLAPSTLEMGRQAAEILLHRIRNGGEDYQDIKLPIEMIRRKSF